MYLVPMDLCETFWVIVRCGSKSRYICSLRYANTPPMLIMMRVAIDWTIITELNVLISRVCRRIYATMPVKTNAASTVTKAVKIS